MVILRGSEVTAATAFFPSPLASETISPPPSEMLKVCLYCWEKPSGLMSPSQTIGVVTNGLGMRPAVSLMSLKPL
jgi:hypothetical protein